MLSKDIMKIVKSAGYLKTFADLKRNHETYLFIKQLTMTPQLKNFAATRNTPIHQAKKVSKINETIIDSSLNFPVFDHSYLLKRKTKT